MDNITLTIPLTPEVLEVIGKAMAKNQEPTRRPPLTVEEFQAAIGGKISKWKIYDDIKAGKIKRVERLSKIMIPFSELERFCG